MPFLVLLWLASAVASEPATTAEPALSPAPTDTQNTFTSALAEAKRAYFEGRTGDALELFQRLEFRLKHAGESPAWTEATEAMTYLGELHLANHEPERAAAAFRWVLERDLGTPMRSPYRHPIEVVTLFEDVRDEVASVRSRATNDLPPQSGFERRRFAPVEAPWTLLPLGLPQLLVQRRPVPGITFLVLQGGLAVTSKVTYDQIKSFNVDPGGGPTELDAFEREMRTRRAIQVSTGGLFYAVWLASAIDAGRAWGKDHPRRFVTVAPGAEGAPGLTFRGTL